MVLETTECIPINNESIIYTDCMEFSLLRFLQLLVYDPKQLCKEGFSNYPKEFECEWILKTHIKKYPKITPNGDHYLNEGRLEREEWACLLSHQDFFEYYRDDHCELFTNTLNIFRFFNGFLSMKLNLQNEQNRNLEIIAQKYSNKNKKIVINMKEEKIEKKEMKMREIIDLLSRPDDEYSKNVDKKYFVTNAKTIIQISINETYQYEWILTEMYFANNYQFKNKFITGHSIINKL